MPNTKMLLLSSLIMAAMVCTTLPGQAATSDAGQAKKPAEKSPVVVEKAPIVVEGDELYFNDSNGDLFANGNVVVTQGQAKVLGEMLRGNAKQNEIWIDDSSTFTEPGTRLVGTTTRYNYGTKTGTMQQASGKVEHEIVTGEQIDFMPDKIIIRNGTQTGCPAKVPDYHLSADRIEIWPGDKLIAYNAKFWIKNTLIYSMPRYQASLKKGAESYMPRFAYSNADGFSITEHLEYPLNDHVSAYYDLAYYTIRGFQPSFGITDQEKNYTLGVLQGYFRDSDGNWVKKEPEFNLGLSHQVGSLPVDYTFTVAYGKWVTDGLTTWRQDYNLNITRRPIKLSDTVQLYFGTGFEHLHWGYDNTSNNTVRYWSGISKTWSPKISTWAQYTYTQNFVVSPIAYGAPDLGRELDTSISYQFDPKNTVQFVQTYDLKLNRPYDQDYYWIHDIHCWTATLEYRAKRKQTIIDFSIKRF